MKESIIYDGLIGKGIEGFWINEKELNPNWIQAEFLLIDGVGNSHDRPLIHTSPFFFARFPLTPPRKNF
ncbi:hypothetical protein [Caldifermentibacillus hisashii]|uniref:hypothetical protein n=1 Tax=Caldifermentibacillus hisashii TaxID=996558 RepID=UPI0034187658